MSGNRADLRGAVRAFAGRVHAPEGGRHHVASPLGAWLLIALAAQAMEGAEREAATAALGMDPMVAAEAAAALLTQVPEAVRAAVAVWHRSGRASEAFEVWQAGLPGAVETGEIPTQPAADAWADRCTDHRVRAFPLPLTEDSALVLASALATRVRWFTPLFSVPATELGPSSPWSRSIKWALAGSDRCAIVRTSPAGLVGVHVKLAAGLVVVSVIAGPEVDALTVLDCAYAIAVDVATDALHSVSLFDLPLGDGVAWTITEMEIPSDRPGERAEQTEGVLPAWSATSDLALSAPGGAFDGFADGLSVLLRPDARGLLRGRPSTGHGPVHPRGLRRGGCHSLGHPSWGGTASRTGTTALGHAAVRTPVRGGRGGRSRPTANAGRDGVARAVARAACLLGLGHRARRQCTARAQPPAAVVTPSPPLGTGSDPRTGVRGYPPVALGRRSQAASPSRAGDGLLPLLGRLARLRGEGVPEPSRSGLSTAQEPAFGAGAWPQQQTASVEAGCRVRAIPACEDAARLPEV